MAEPFVNGCDVAVPPSTESCTLPVGVPPAELTVTVTLPLLLKVMPGAETEVEVATWMTLIVNCCLNVFPYSSFV